MNTICAFPAYLQDYQLSRYGDAEGGWIFSLYLFMTYGNGLRVGPAFDAVWSAFLSEYLQFSMVLVHFHSLLYPSRRSSIGSTFVMASLKELLAVLAH